MMLIAYLMDDSEIRSAVDQSQGLAREPMSVWTDSDQSWSLTELAPSHLPKWEELTEFMKMFLGFDAAMEFNSGYAFTAHILPTIVNRWKLDGSNIVDNATQRLRRALIKEGLKGIPFCFVMETRSRSGKSRTKPHLHGYCLSEDPLDATRFKVALEIAFNPGFRRLGKRSAVLVERCYDFRAEFIGRAQWVKYLTKNVDRWDAILGKRRIFVSRSLIGIARDAWAIRTER